MTHNQTLRGYPVMLRRFEFAGRTFELLGPANHENLIDDPRVVARFQKDEFMPYWAEFWPASLLLADLVAAWPRGDLERSLHDENSSPGEKQAVPARRDGRSTFVLELGAGLGLASLIACHLGYRVLCSDYDDDALAFVRASAERNGIPSPETRYIDWRERYDDLRFDRIIAADILYEKRNLEPVAAFVARHLKPGGEALIVDRNRPTADAFEAIARAAGFSVEIETVQRSGYNEPRPLLGRVFHLRGMG